MDDEKDNIQTYIEIVWFWQFWSQRHTFLRMGAERLCKLTNTYCQTLLIFSSFWYSKIQTILESTHNKKNGCWKIMQTDSYINKTLLIFSSFWRYAEIASSRRLSLPTVPSESLVPLRVPCVWWLFYRHSEWWTVGELSQHTYDPVGRCPKHLEQSV